MYIGYMSYVKSYEHFYESLKIPYFCFGILEFRNLKFGIFLVKDTIKTYFY